MKNYNNNIIHALKNSNFVIALKIYYYLRSNCVFDLVSILFRKLLLKIFIYIPIQRLMGFFPQTTVS